MEKKFFTRKMSQSNQNFKLEDNEIQDDMIMVENLLSSRTFNYKPPRKPGQSKNQLEKLEQTKENSL